MIVEPRLNRYRRDVYSIGSSFLSTEFTYTMMTLRNRSEYILIESSLMRSNISSIWKLDILLTVESIYFVFAWWVFLIVYIGIRMRFLGALPLTHLYLMYMYVRSYVNQIVLIGRESLSRRGLREAKSSFLAERFVSLLLNIKVLL